jgi:hypothetical protein
VVKAQLGLAVVHLPTFSERLHSPKELDGLIVLPSLILEGKRLTGDKHIQMLRSEPYWPRMVLGFWVEFPH